MIDLDPQTSRRRTGSTAAYVAQLPLGAWPPASPRRWVRDALELRVAESAADRALYSGIVRRHHYLERWPCKPRVKLLAYLADLAGVQPGPAGAASMAMFALQPVQCRVARALELHPCQRLELVRCWRAADLGPDVAPMLMAETLRRIIWGGRHTLTCIGRQTPPCTCIRQVMPGLRFHLADCLRKLPASCNCGRLEPLARVWNDRQLTNGLIAPARLLVTHADPTRGHDGALYLAAGAVFCGRGAQGKLTFAWPLDPALATPLRAYAVAVADREKEHPHG